MIGQVPSRAIVNLILAEGPQDMRFLAAFATALLLAPFGTLISYPFL